MAEQNPYEPPPDGWRTFLIVWATQTLSYFGSALTEFTFNIWLVTSAYPLESQKPQLALALSAINIAFAIPIVFGAPIAGATVDRHDRKRLMILTDALSGLMSLVILTLIATHTLNIYILVVIVAVNAILSSFHMAAFDTSYVMLLPNEKLARANGMMQTSYALSGVIAPGVAAALIAVPGLARQAALPGFFSFLGGIQDGAVVAIGIDVISFFQAAIIILPLYIPSPARTDIQEAGKPQKSIWEEIGIGFRFIWRRRSFLWLLGSFALFNFVNGIAALMETLIVRFQLQPGWAASGFTIETALAMAGTITSLGGVAGGVLVSTWGGLKQKRIFGVLIPMALSGIGIALLGLSRHFYLAMAAVALNAIMMPVMSAHSQSVWQQQTPREIQGRVFSVRRLIAQFTWPASAFLAGLLATRFDPGMVIAILGALLVIWCVVNLFNPYLMRVEDTQWTEAQAHKYETAPETDGLSPDSLESP